jgi:hypothetical protein
MEQIKLDILISMLAHELRNMPESTLTNRVEMVLRTGKYSANTVAGAMGDMYGLSVPDMFNLMDKYSSISCVN